MHSYIFNIYLDTVNQVPGGGGGGVGQGRVGEGIIPMCHSTDVRAECPLFQRYQV